MCSLYLFLTFARAAQYKTSKNTLLQNTLSQELYHQSYSRVGVVFASITNYHEFYTELDGNNQGVECLRLLNEIIADFDDLLSEERFKAIDKIKTVGSTYMAAIGLMPDLRILDDDETTAGIHLSTLVEFVFAMRDRLLNINENSYNNFMLRVGKRNIISIEIVATCYYYFYYKALILVQ